ncbi:MULTISPECIES: hypothetical protein [unclassified Pseudomonas]|jgi:hypothetical protein|uniref:hypothetical protein n=1 Tax=unclassified Pseudomonas TaxID=196821 RepID=UPI001CBD1256|nr:MULTISPECIES: hypothetical protein [unclassified Pseudomonas]
MIAPFRKTIVVVMVAHLQIAVAEEDQSFNKYILASVDKLYSQHHGGGYNISKAYTHDMQYGDAMVKATEPPLSMCVSAVAEVIITAINLYAAENNDKTPLTYLPASGWNRMRPIDIRSHIWVDHRLDSFGTADALVTFGVGKRTAFKNLKPGAFVNINRTNKSGHAVVFIGFVDGKGVILSTYSDEVRGFKYFSSQGRGNIGDAGFAFRYAFFEKNGVKYCPEITTGKRDCGVIWSAGQKYLNTGYMLPPSKWDSESKEKNLKLLVSGLYKQTRSKGVGFLGVDPNVSEKQFEKAIEATDTMKLGESFIFGNATTDE